MSAKLLSKMVKELAILGFVSFTCAAHAACLLLPFAAKARCREVPARRMCAAARRRAPHNRAAQQPRCGTTARRAPANLESRSRAHLVAPRTRPRPPRDNAVHPYPPAAPCPIPTGRAVHPYPPAAPCAIPTGRA
eukprot:1473046-Prymnesium_polylepis.1